MRILIIDNNDSFTYNLLQLVRENSSASTKVIQYGDVRSKDWDLADKVIISPGPGVPEDFAEYSHWLNLFGQTKAVLGICMGHEILAQYYGCKISRLDSVSHGQRKNIRILTREHYIFRDMEESFDIGLYHSWIVERDNLNKELEINCEDEVKSIMGMHHNSLDLIGFQFHPESYMTKEGYKLMQNWIAY